MITDDQIKNIGFLITDLNEELRKADEIGHLKKVIDLKNELSGIYGVVKILGIEDKVNVRVN